MASRGCLRFFIFFAGYVTFLILGASVFLAIEGPEELQQVKSLRSLRFNFLKKHKCVPGRSAYIIFFIKKCRAMEKTTPLLSSPSGNRLGTTRVAGEYSTTEPWML